MALEAAASSVFGLLRATAEAGSREILTVAAQDEFVRGGGKALCAEEFRKARVGVEREGGGDAALRGAVAQQFGVIAFAERQAERVEQDGFTRARLAGEHAQAGGEFQRSLFHQRNVLYAQIVQHRDIYRMSGSHPELSLFSFSICVFSGFIS